MCLANQPTTKINCLEKNPVEIELSSHDDSQEFSVPTFVDKKQQSIDIAELDASDLKSLQSTDPFMYHSIPSVKDATMRGKPSPSHTSSFEFNVGEKRKASQEVIRQSRVSTESHPDLLLEDMLREIYSMQSNSSAEVKDIDLLNDYFGGTSLQENESL
jgi:hypothetical protein